MSKKIEDGMTAQSRYVKKNIITASLRLNRRTDADIVEYLDAHDGGNRQGFIKQILRQWIAQNLDPEN